MSVFLEFVDPSALLKRAVESSLLSFHIMTLRPGDGLDVVLNEQEVVMSDRPAVRLLVSGRVQGVGFRYWTIGEARRLGLEGWVRNRQDGTVEILAIGPAEALGKLAQICRQGPASARVIAVARGGAPDDGSRDFTEKPTIL